MLAHSLKSPTYCIVLEVVGYSTKMYSTYPLVLGIQSLATHAAPSTVLRGDGALLLLFDVYVKELARLGSCMSVMFP